MRCARAHRLAGTPRDETALAGAISRVLQDRKRAKRLGQAGYDRVVQEFSLASQIVRIEQVLEKTIALRTSTRVAA